VITNAKLHVIKKKHFSAEREKNGNHEFSGKQSAGIFNVLCSYNFAT
jgi:hypothetical protein